MGEMIAAWLSLAVLVAGVSLPHLLLLYFRHNVDPRDARSVRRLLLYFSVWIAYLVMYCFLQIRRFHALQHGIVLDSPSPMVLILVGVPVAPVGFWLVIDAFRIYGKTISDAAIRRRIQVFGPLLLWLLMAVVWWFLLF